LQYLAQYFRQSEAPSELSGVIWSETTIWPPGYEKLVKSSSRSIRRGVYQVSLDNSDY
jgi:hypothetical protein